MNKQLFVIWVTHGCNLRCTYCYENKDSNLFMSHDTSCSVVNYILEFVHEKNIFECDIHFHGGEPLLNYDVVKEIVCKLNKNEERKFNYSVTTNATLLTQEKAKFLEENFHTISVSLDGDQDSHDSNRKTINNKGTFIDVIKGISYFSNYSKIRVRMTVTSANVGNFYENYKRIAELGFYWIEPGIDLFCDWDDDLVKKLEDNLFKIREYINMHLHIHEFDAINNEFYIMNGCEGGESNINIDYDGMLYPCSFSLDRKEMIIGDVVSGINMEALRKLRNKYTIPLSECSGCNMKRYCIATNCRILQEIVLDRNDKALPILCRMQNIKYKIYKKYYSLGKEDKDYENQQN